MGNMLVDINNGSHQFKSITYKPSTIYELRPLKNQEFLEFYTSEDNKFFYAKKSYARLLNGSGDNLFISGEELGNGVFEWEQTFKPYTDLEDTNGTLHYDKKFNHKLFYDGLTAAKIDGGKTAVYTYRWTINNENVEAKLRWKDYDHQYSFTIKYYLENRYKKINRIEGLGDDRVAVFGEGNITIARLSANQKSSILWSITERNKSFISGDITPDKKYLVSAYLASDGSLGTLILDLNTGKHKTKTISYKPEKLLKIECGNNGMFYELYKNTENDYRVARKSYTKLWENPEQKIFLNWKAPIKNGSIITDIYYDNDGLLYIGQTKSGYWFLGKYASDLSKEYWFTSLKEKNEKSGCSFLSVSRVKNKYVVIGGQFTSLDFPGVDISNCRGGESILIQTDLNGNITSHTDYDELDKIKYRALTNYKDEYKPNVKLGISVDIDSHFILVDDHGTEKDEIHKISLFGWK